MLLINQTACQVSQISRFHCCLRCRIRGVYNLVVCHTSRLLPYDMLECLFRFASTYDISLLQGNWKRS